MLQDRGIAHALLDLDWLRYAYPPPPDDPFNSELELKNLAAVVDNYRRAGVDRLVIAGVIENRAMRSRYESVLGMPLTVCRLRIVPARLRERLILRHPPGEDRTWHLNRSSELDHALDTSGVNDFTIHVQADKPADVASRVLHSVGWVQ